MSNIRRLGHSLQHMAAIGTTPRALRAVATGALALGGFALGAIAVGAMAFGALAIGRLAVGRARVGRLEIEELSVRRLVVTEELQVPRGMTSGASSEPAPEQAASPTSPSP